MGIFDSVFDTVTDLFHTATGLPTAADKRNRDRMLNDQISAYKRQTELAQSQLSKMRDQEIASKRRLEEKQIRNLRRSFRPAGFLDDGSGLTEKLGE